MTTKQSESAWSGMVSIDDTALAVTDTGGPGRPVVYLNGSYADQSHWRRVITELGSDYRHITYDERARGRSKRATDYSSLARDVGGAQGSGLSRPCSVISSPTRQRPVGSDPFRDRRSYEVTPPVATAA